MVKKACFWVLLTLMAANFSFAQMPASHVVLNAFQISGATSTDEFVELYNPGTEAVSLVGWRLAKKTASGTLSNLITTFPEHSLLPGGRLLIGHKNSKSSVQLYYTTSGSIASDNTIVLYSDAGKSIVDKVGFGKASDFEATALLNPKANEILSRDNGVDTDDNQNDFYSSIEEESEGTTNADEESFDLTITELLPNPEGADSEGEWIEVYNNGARTNLGGLVLSDTIGSPKKYKIPAGMMIGARSYLVFRSTKTHISLNNDGDVVEIRTATGRLIDSSEVNYGKSPEGVSYALFGNTWAWTAMPTPGQSNVKKTVVLEKKTKKKKGAKKTKKSGEVLGFNFQNEEEILGDAEEGPSPSEKKLGFGLLAVAILAGSLYTLYVNREKAVEISNKFRTRYQATREKFCQKVKK